MKIKVTQEDIDIGIPLSVRFCPVVMAIKRATRSKHVFAVGRTAWIGKKERLAHLDEEARDFMWKFDKDHLVKPFEFELNYVK